MDNLTWCEYYGVVDDVDTRRYLEWLSQDDLKRRLGADPILENVWHAEIQAMYRMAKQLTKTKPASFEEYTNLLQFLKTLTACEDKRSILTTIGLCLLESGQSYADVTANLKRVYLKHGLTMDIA